MNNRNIEKLETQRQKQRNSYETITWEENELLSDGTTLCALPCKRVAAADTTGKTFDTQMHGGNDTKYVVWGIEIRYRYDEELH